MQPIETVEDTCPYCGTAVTVELDSTTSCTDFVEDCQVCCAPILYQVLLDGLGEVVQIRACRENE